MTTTCEKRATYHKKAFRQVLHIAKEQAKADQSDPFSFNHHASHMFNGVTEMQDYNVDWKAETRVTPRGEKYSIQIPSNVKRP